MRSDVEFLDVQIVDLTHDGQGVADLGERRVFVPGALPGERVRLTLRRRRRQYHEADLVEILEPSVERVEPPCKYFGRCGGCAVQHFSYEAQVTFKQTIVQEALSRIAGVEPEVWLEPILGPQWNYRRRARLGVRFVKGKDRVLVGFKERATRYVTDMVSCRVLVKPLDKLPGELSDAIGETSLRQRLPQVEVSAGENVRAAVLRVLNDPTEDDLSIFRNLGRQQELDVYLQRAGPGTIRAIDPSGVGQLAYSLPDFDLTLHFSPTDFLQVNAEVNAALVTQTLRLLEVQKNDRVLDLYCGLGNFSLPLARHAGEVLGVEGESGLVARAAGNAHLNKIDNVSFIAGDLNQLEWSFMRGAWDLVVLDPPRSGAQAIVSQMAQIAPRRIAYVSCHPATLARDAKELIKSAGYQLIAVGIADMFPHTHHVESIALFEKSKGI